MRRLRPLLLAAAGACLVAPATASAGEYVAGEVIVKREGEPAKVIRTEQGVREKVRELERMDGVEFAAPNPIARASAYVPNDRGLGGPGGWAEVQWNFLPGVGVNAPVAWQHLIDAGRPGGKGVVVAVLDTGVAYRSRGPYRRSPDMGRTRFRRGYDFIDRDPYPNDENGHGTHVASTIAESTGNGYGLTGLAYGASIMPLRVLDRYGEGDAADIARAIRFAVRRGAHVINLSLEFARDTRAKEIPDLLNAMADARRKGVLIVGASGNEAIGRIAFPARSRRVLSVGATTEHGCLSDFSNLGRGLGIVAPGGGGDTSLDDPHCKPDDTPGRPIYQITMNGSLRKFGMPAVYEGTSMAAPHVSATAALVIASGVLGPEPTPAQLEARLKGTARDLGPPGTDTRFGAGLLDAAAATDPANRVAVPSRARQRR